MTDYRIINSWGNYPKIKGELIQTSNEEQLKKIINLKNTIIPYGNGRSYGDSALNSCVVKYKSHRNNINFNRSKGIVEIDAGLKIGDLIDHVLPFGYFPPVVPGTKTVTVGGAIAADIHGKNHHVDGCISNHIISFNLMLQNGHIVNCSKELNSELFRATCGGMGLTGVILNAKLKLISIKSNLIEQNSCKAKNIDELFSYFEYHDSRRFSVAWVDCFSSGNELGRGIYMSGDFLRNGIINSTNSYNFKFNIPDFCPTWLINPFSQKIFNQLYYNINGLNRKKTILIDYENFFFPLDKILNWNRLYGKSGFLQYQFVIPKDNSIIGIKKILNMISRSNHISPLAVLKLFGKRNENYLSFPIKGYTLALDFKIQPDIFSFLDELDKIVIDYGGRVYLAKDARTVKNNFELGYPNIKEFRTFRSQSGLNNKFHSNQSLRLEL